MICKHRLINVGDPIYEWCRQCGILIYQYEDYGVIPPEDISFNGTELVYNKNKHLIIRNKILNPSDVRINEDHKHDLFKLSGLDSWCKICGCLKMKRHISSDGLNLEVKEGILIPQIRKSCFEVRNEAGM